MDTLCSRPDFLGRVGRYYLTNPESLTRLNHSPATRRSLERNRQPRLSLRALASYRMLLMLLMLYVLGALLSFGPASSTVLILLGALLHGFFMMMFGEKLKTH